MKFLDILIHTLLRMVISIISARIDEYPRAMLKNTLIIFSLHLISSNLHMGAIKETSMTISTCMCRSRPGTYQDDSVHQMMRSSTTCEQMPSPASK